MTTIHHDAADAVELRRILEFFAEWIAEDDDVIVAGYGYTTDELHDQLINLANWLLAAIHP